MTTDSIWSYAQTSGYAEGLLLTGFTVAAVDGTFGHVDRQVDQSGMRHLIVDTGGWVFGRSVLVPVGLVTFIDPEAREIKVACTEDEIKAAPRFKTDRETLDPEYLTGVGHYYRSLPPRQATTT
ncbi:PRC-barrel domain containing protein [Streptomyces sp. NPDC057621]|uniref:PRC-barrel domain containing protein n=1 Tax=Streptomyces liliiviolaceus TaxID=2823109 RepID=A0A940Y5X5_9ACTN|nr:PRC-barrel domain containing protein [Streptomyces liliiviolaceus]MBQ0855168.1 PRC-barrel domain containing protein [Streptomyces liliiviolaceus]